MIVRESIEFQRGGGSPLKSLGVGHIDLARKIFIENNIPVDDLIESLEKLAKRYTIKAPLSDRVFADVDLSRALDREFDEETYSLYKGGKEYKAHSTKARKFFKDMIFNIRRNDSKLSEIDFYQYASQFLRDFNEDPHLFEIIINDLLLNSRQDL